MTVNSFTPFKGRTITEGELVDVYRNLHNGKWSIRSCATGLVLGHAEYVELRACMFIVGEAGRQRVIKEKKKNVHAIVRGALDNTLATVCRIGDLVTYNPYYSGSFHMKYRPVETVESARRANFRYNGTVIINS